MDDLKSPHTAAARRWHASSLVVGAFCAFSSFSRDVVAEALERALEIAHAAILSIISGSQFNLVVRPSDVGQFVEVWFVLIVPALLILCHVDAIVRRTFHPNLVIVLSLTALLPWFLLGPCIWLSAQGNGLFLGLSLTIAVGVRKAT